METSKEKIFICLVSNGVSDSKQAARQRNAKTILMARQIPYMEVDGMNPNDKDRRNELFKVSGIRGAYPQFFFLYKSGEASFLGDWDTFEDLNDTTSIPKDVLANNPNIETWDKIFDGVVKSFV